jgi:hypothetical protein
MSRSLTLAVIALLLLTVLLYIPILSADFCLVDDSVFVWGNVHVRQGLTADTLVWAMRTTAVDYWHPLAWLSHAADVQLYGLRPAGHHATSVALHVVAVALVFCALRALTGAAWRSLAVAAVFALHPMNVESVAWISERKNVLAGIFYAATLLAYAGYARRPGPARYAGVTLLILCGLASKPMLVTLPFVLLLLDFWPLERWRERAAWRLVLEKVPWIAVSFVVCVVTVRAVEAVGSLVAVEPGHMTSRVCVAVASAGTYAAKLLWPSNLSFWIPLPASPCETLPVKTSAVALVALSAAALWLYRRAALVVGWAWFLGMLVPVCGLIQVSPTWIADRYVYQPMIGLAVCLIFGATAALSPRWTRVVGFVVVAACGVLAWRTHVEVGYWRSNEALFTRSLELTPVNCMAETQLGVVRRNARDPEGAIMHWRRAIAECPDSWEAHSHLGAVLAARGELEAAIPHFASAAELNPDLAPAMWYDLGLALWYKGRRDEALAEFRRAVTLDPHHQPSLEMIRRIESAAP